MYPVCARACASGCICTLMQVIRKLTYYICMYVYIYIYIYVYQMDCVCQRYHKECSYIYDPPMYDAYIYIHIQQVYTDVCIYICSIYSYTHMPTHISISKMICIHKLRHCLYISEGLLDKLLTFNIFITPKPKIDTMQICCRCWHVVVNMFKIIADSVLRTYESVAWNAAYDMKLLQNHQFWLTRGLICGPPTRKTTDEWQTFTNREQINLYTR